jgi:hypothetical protein
MTSKGKNAIPGWGLADRSAIQVVPEALATHGWKVFLQIWGGSN